MGAQRLLAVAQAPGEGQIHLALGRCGSHANSRAVALAVEGIDIAVVQRHNHLRYASVA